MKTRVRIALLIVIVALVGLLVQNRQEALAAMQNILGRLDFYSAAALFTCAFIAGSILLIPASVFIIAAGALFGLYKGFVLGMLAFTVASCCTFLLSRHLVSDLVLRWLPARIMRVISNIHQHGWKLVAVLRVSGLVPSAAVNYALGITRIRLWEFAWSSLVFTMPAGLIFAYAGVAGKEFIESGNLQRLLLTVSAVVVVVAVLYLLRRYISRRQRAKTGQP